MYAVLVGLLTLLVAVAAQDKYTTKYDGVDVDKILTNERLLQSYFNCVMDKGKCTPEGAELKKNVGEALATECAKCSEKQKIGAEKVLKYLYEKKPELFKQVEAKFDSDGKYRKKYKELAKQKGIKV